MAEGARLFHLVAADAWRPGTDAWTPPGFAREGFVHLSFAAQLPGTLAAHFAGVERAWLVEVELADAAALRQEPSRGGALFPHLYRPLALAELARHWELSRADGALSPPSLGPRPDEDRPPARPGPPPQSP